MLKKQYFVCIFFLILGCKKQLEKIIEPKDLPPKKIELFGEGTISTRMNELGSSISPDGNLLLYTIANNSYSHTFYTIFVSQKLLGNWSKPKIAPFSGRYSDADPFFDPADGQKIYFISNRPTKIEIKEDYDIWSIDYDNGNWSEPERLDNSVNSKSDELYPSITKNGNLYFSRENGKNGYDILVSGKNNSGFGLPVSVSDSINSSAIEFDAYIDPDETFMIFTSIGRKDSFGSGDLYISFKYGNEWTSAKNLGEKINSAFMDQCPYVTLDGKTFLFTSFRDNNHYKYENEFSTQSYINQLNSPFNGLGNIFWVDSSVLNIETIGNCKISIKPNINDTL